MTQGYISLHRKILDWEWKSCPTTFAFFIHCLLKANWKDKKWRGETIKRGEFVSKLDELASEVGLSVKQVRERIKRLERANVITYDGSGNNSKISVVNYDMYQRKDDENRDGGQIKDKLRANEGQIKGTQRARTNKDNKDNNINNNIYIPAREEEKPKKKKKKVKLDELSVDHIMPWLEKKRLQGFYRDIDEHAVLERFKDYCKAKGKRYSDYIAAYRNAFAWKNAPRKGGLSRYEKKKGIDWDERARRLKEQVYGNGTVMDEGRRIPNWTNVGDDS